MRLALLLVLLASSTVSAQELSKPRFPELLEARKTGLGLAGLVVEKLTDDARFPGIKAWRDEYNRFVEPMLGKSPEDWGTLDVDALCSRNPRFWEMTYEIFPGDPALMLLHAGLLMTAGELTRAAQIAHLGLQRGNIPKPFQSGLNTVVSQYQKVSEKANIIVFAGIKSYDEGDYGTALKKYQEAVNLWPQNSFAWYEAGLTMLQQERIAAGKKPIPTESFAVQDEALSKDVDYAFQRARLSDPFQLRAYQGPDKELIASLNILNKKVVPTWEKLVANKGKPANEETLTELSQQLQEAQLNDLALITRQVLVARRSRFVNEDHPFIGTSLKRTIPHPDADQILKRLGNAKLEFRQLVKPEVEK